MVDIYGKPNQTVRGTNGDDNIWLTGDADAYGLGGDDSLFGTSSDNKLYGGDGADSIYPGEGNDLVMGGRGNDRLSGSYGSSKVYGEGGDDILYTAGGAGDFLDGGAGNDWIYGVDYDSMRGGAGNDTLIYVEQWRLEEPKEVKISGGAGRDTLRFEINEQSAGITGQTIEIHMSGESRGVFFMDSVPKGTFTGINEISGVDYFFKPVHLVYHGEDADTDMAVIGGDLGDQFYAGAGNETFTAGAGDDMFTFAFNEKGMGRDTIHNFGDSDIIGFTSSKDELRTTAVEHNGWTTYTSKYLDGTLAHVLNVDAVGLPPIQYDVIIG